jgi:integrase
MKSFSSQSSFDNNRLRLGQNSAINAISKYIKNVGAMNKTTANQYQTRLNSFSNYVAKEYSKTVSIDDLIKRIREGAEDPFDILNGYIGFLKQKDKNLRTSLSPVTLKSRVVTVKNFLEYYDVDISPRKFKLKVKLPRIIRKNKEALSKDDVTDILNACSDIRLKTYVMLLAAGGFRAVEALSLRIKDLDLESNLARAFVRGEYTKTKTDRIVFLTDELTQQLKSWLSYKYRTRRICYKDWAGQKYEKKTITEYRTPDKNDTDLIFAIYQNTKMPNPSWLYADMAKTFAKTLDRMGKGDREDGNERRRQITLHSFRRFVKSTISDLGYGDYSEWFIGHSGSTYWRKKESEKAELFRKIEPYLTFLNIHQLERQGADIQTKVEELEDINSSLRERDKVKDDAIAHLSDQLMTLSARLQELERKQQAAVI